jgi:cytochrome c
MPAGVRNRAAGVLLLALAEAGASTGAGRAADSAYGEYLAAECATCHGAAAPDQAIPPLQGLAYDRLVAALEQYRDGTRSNEVMRSVARSLGDAEIAALAEYFSRPR